MADIYAFPTGAPNEGHPERPQGVPDDVWAAVESVSAMKRLYDVRYREIPVPSTLADYGIGVELEAGERMDRPSPLPPTVFPSRMLPPDG